MKGACESFMNKYRQTSGTVALVQSNKLEALAAAVKNVVTAVGNKQVDLTAIQGYEGLNPHLFYDLEQYIEALTNDTDAFKAALKEAVIFTDHTHNSTVLIVSNPSGCLAVADSVALLTATCFLILKKLGWTLNGRKR